MTLESVDDILGGDGLALGVVGVDERVADDDVEEGLQDLAGLRVDGGGNALDSSTTRETADCGLCDPSEYVFVFRPVLEKLITQKKLSSLRCCELL